MAVHGAYEASDEIGGRLFVKGDWIRELFDMALSHNYDAIRHGKCLGLVVRDVDDRQPQLLCQLGELCADLHAQRGVEGGQRLIHKQDIWIRNQRAGDGNALLLATGKLVWPRLRFGSDTHHVHAGSDLLGPLACRHLIAWGGQRKLDVLFHRHVWPQCEVLEDHRKPALIDGYVGSWAKYLHLSEGDGSRVRRF